MVKLKDELEMALYAELLEKKKIVIEGIAHKYKISTLKVLDFYKKLEREGLCEFREVRHREESIGEGKLWSKARIK